MTETSPYIEIAPYVMEGVDYLETMARADLAKHGFVRPCVLVLGADGTCRSFEFPYKHGAPWADPVGDSDLHTYQFACGVIGTRGREGDAVLRLHTTTRPSAGRHAVFVCEISIGYVRSRFPHTPLDEHLSVPFVFELQQQQRQLGPRLTLHEWVKADAHECEWVMVEP